MADVTSQTVGQTVAQRLQCAVKRYQAAGLHTARDVIRGVDKSGAFTRSVDDVQHDVRGALVSSDVLYFRGDNLMMEVDRPAGKSLVTLTDGRTPRTGAHAMLGSVFLCESVNGKNGTVTQYLPPRDLLHIICNDDQLYRVLPAMERYALRPVLSKDFRLLGPGYHSEERTLVHGPAVEPFLDFAPPPEGLLLDCLPPHLRYLLRYLPLASDTDLANLVGVQLTAIMPEHFSESGRPLAVLDGNQPDLAKTAIVRETSITADGAAPPEMTFTTNDEELEKGIASRFRDTESSVFLIDNVRVAGNRPIESPVLERLLTSERIQSRILGHTHVLDEPNDRLWALTCNGGQLGRDILSRSVVVRFRFEGDADARTIPEDMIAWTRTHRLELLAELFGMIQRWIDAGRPRADVYHRFREWAATIGGILEANGLGSHFLSNRDEVVEEYDSSIDEFRVLAETALASPSGATSADTARPARDWANWFYRAGVSIDGLSTGSPNRSVATQIGRWLSGRLGQAAVVMGPDGGDATLTLRRSEVRSNTNLYYFELSDTARPDVTDTAERTRNCEMLPEAAPPAPTAAPGNSLIW